MKKIYVLLLALVLVFSAGCNTTAQKKDASESAKPAEKINFEYFSHDAPDGTDFIIVVNPTEDQKKHIKVTNRVQLDDGGNDLVYIMPGSADSNMEIAKVSVNMRSIDLEKGETVANEAVAEDGCIEIKTLIPEGVPHHGVYLKNDEAKEKSYILSYDGKGETNIYYR